MADYARIGPIGTSPAMQLTASELNAPHRELFAWITAAEEAPIRRVRRRKQTEPAPWTLCPLVAPRTTRRTPRTRRTSDPWPPQIPPLPEPCRPFPEPRIPPLPNPRR